MTTVRIVTDSSCDLPEELVAELGIDVVPLKIRFGDQELVDRVDLTPAEFWANMNPVYYPELARRHIKGTKPIDT